MYVHHSNEQRLPQGVGRVGVVREEPFLSYIVHESYKTWGVNNIVHYDTAVERNRLQH